MYQEQKEIIHKKGLNIPKSNHDGGVLDNTLCDKVCEWFSLGTLISSTNDTDQHDITKLLLRGALNS